MTKVLASCSIALVFSISIVNAQPQDDPRPWRAATGADEQGPPPPPAYTANQGPQNAPLPPQAAPQYAPLPATLQIRPGSFITVRLDQTISSDHNQQGDSFFAALAEPIVVDGIVVAQRGQTVRGRITEAQKAGRVEGTSRLALELTSLTLVDGSQMSTHSRLVTRDGHTSVGRDVAAVGTTTALGAAIGATADWYGGTGAAIGAGAGAAAGLIGVLLTRGHPTVLYPETVLTFELDSPVNVDTGRAPQAFRYAEPSDYGHPPSGPEGPRYAARGPVPPPPPYYGPAYAPWYGGTGFSVVIGPRYYRGWYGPYRGYYHR
jgi:hypothetical protein